MFTHISKVYITFIVSPVLLDAKIANCKMTFNAKVTQYKVDESTSRGAYFTEGEGELIPPPSTKSVLHAGFFFKLVDNVENTRVIRGKE